MKNDFYKSFLLLVIVLVISVKTWSQNSDKIKTAFKASTTINNQTAKTVKKGAFEFGLQHRFGEIDVKNEMIKNFFGMDLSSNIRFDFTFGLTNNFHLGVGRTKYRKNYDFYFKYRPLSQTNTVPFNLAIYSNMAIMSDDFPDTENYFKSDSITPFVYKYTDRFSYHSQIILSRAFTPWFSFQVSPNFTFHNIVNQEEANYRMAFPIAARFKVAMFSSILFEYSWVPDKPILEKGKLYDPIAVAFEVSTTSHVFQITLSNTNKILDQWVYYSPGVQMSEGHFYLGFNLFRRFYYKKS